MNRAIATIAVLAVVGIAYSGPQDEKQSDKQTKGLQDLHGERIALLSQRVEVLEQMVDVGVVGASDIIPPRLDLIQAQLDYSGDVETKRKLYDEMLSQYDKLIELKESLTHAPRHPSQKPNQRINAASDLLFVKAERIRIQIERDSL